MGAMRPGIYIHIPFCHSKCIYCDFYSVARRDSVDAVVQGIVTEFDARAGELGDDAPGTIYLGGGTPSSLPPQAIAEIAAALPTDSVTEFTIEVNPEDVTRPAAEAWAAAGVNRVSMGVQSLDDSLLRWMRRRHTAADALHAIDTLRTAGIENVSCDLIYGLPRLDRPTWTDTLTRLLSAGIDHLSAYCLTYHSGTALTRRFERGLDPTPDDDCIADQFAILRQLTADAGFEHYEISNFGRPGRHSAHNSLYWHPLGRWLGLGPAAHSFDGHTRRIDPADIRLWLSRLPYPCDIEDETELDRLNDTIVSALRTARGLDLSCLDPATARSLISDARPHLESGHMILNDSHLAIKAEHWLISDRFIRDMIRDNMP